MYSQRSVDRTANENFKFNRETEFVPILGLIESQLNFAPADQGTPREAATGASSIQANHHASLLSLLAQELSVAPEEIHDFELYGLLLLKYLEPC